MRSFSDDLAKTDSVKKLAEDVSNTQAEQRKVRRWMIGLGILNLLVVAVVFYTAFHK